MPAFRSSLIFPSVRRSITAFPVDLILPFYKLLLSFPFIYFILFILQVTRSFVHTVSNKGHHVVWSRPCQDFWTRSYQEATTEGIFVREIEGRLPPDLGHLAALITSVKDATIHSFLLQRKSKKGEVG